MEKDCCLFYRHDNNKLGCVVSVQEPVPKHNSERLFFFRDIQAFKQQHKLCKLPDISFIYHVHFDNALFFDAGEENVADNRKDAHEGLCYW